MDTHGGKRLSEAKDENCPGSAAVSAATQRVPGGQDARAPILVPDLTDEQRRAITARDVSVALSAGAGCGKTFVLTERFLFQLEPQAWGQAGPAKLGQLVAITFTERAAREMRDRIRSACGRRLLTCGEDQVDYWRELIRELDTARISTIHSFCGSLLRAHAVEARLDPRFRVLDQAQADTLLFGLLGEHLHDRLAARDEAVIELVVQFNLEKLYRMISALLSQRQEIDWPQWRGTTADDLVARWLQYWRGTFLPGVLGEISTSSAAPALLEIIRRHCPSHPVMQQRCELLLERLPKLAQSADPPADLEAICEAAKVQGGGGKKAWPSEEIYDRFRDAAAELRDDIKRAKEKVAFDPQAARPAAETALRMLALADGVAEAYESKKQELAVLDFNDLLIRAKQLLMGTDRGLLRKRLAAQMRLLLVDEFQDTDPLQVELVEALCDEQLIRGKLFFVGDYKQSIYRFRGAQPQIFRQLREKMPAQGRLPLSMNFRSQPAVLDFVNALFCEVLGPEYEPLRPHRPQVGPVPAVEFLWAPDPAAEGTVPIFARAKMGLSPSEMLPTNESPAFAEMGEAERLRRREADWIARRIRTLLDSGAKIVWDEEAAKAGRPAVRPVRPGDIALLFRALSNVELYEAALRRYGIDYYLVGGHAFYSQQEVFDLLNLLRAVCSPNDEISLLGVLRSPFFGLLDETLFWLAQHPEGFSGGVLAETLPAELSESQRQRVRFAAATLRGLRATKDRLPLARWLNEALARTGYDAALLAEFLGERKLANLRKLIEQARSFDRSGIFSLADFVTQLSEFVARQPDEALAATQPEQSDVVRLMTIHQSKGLEFPVVIVPDVDRVRHGPLTPVAFTPELGPMIKDSDCCGGFDLYQHAQRSEELAEIYRLLYVATTRAADYLILSSGVRKLGVARGPWTELINRRFDPLSGRLLVQLRAGYGVPQIAVTTSEPPLEYRPAGGAGRRNLQKLIEEARQQATAGTGRVPPLLAPIPSDPAARRQLSFSRLRGTLHAPEMASADADAGSALDPRGLGTLVHAVLAEIDFADPGDVTGLVRRHALRHLPQADGNLDEPVEMIRRFLASPRAAELAAARQIHAELEFLLAWPPAQGDCPNFRPSENATVPAGGGKRSGENGTVPLGNRQHYIQGFIDCLYQDRSDHWHLLDYKTNRVGPGGIDALAAEYEMQMLLYALTAERILEQPPAELVLCFLRPAVEYHFDWNDQARRRAVELVEQAMAAQRPV